MIDNDQTIIELNNETIRSMNHVVRDQKVMLDFDLAKIYGYDTRSFNRQVKRNINKFPERYRFQLTKEEISKITRSQNVMSIMQEKGQKGGRVYYPYAFTEQGIYMLMTVLKGDLAAKQSILLIDTFKQMKDYIIESNNLLLNTNSYIDFNTDDYKIYHCGASSKDSGKSVNTIIEIKEKELYISLIEKVL